MIEVQVEFPERAPGQRLSLLGCRRLSDDATQFDAVLAFGDWSRSGFGGTENSEHLGDRGPITLHLVAA